jgi:5-methylcytosine-specific restriction endonuclease McrA
VTPPRRMPTAVAIRWHWAQVLVDLEKFDSVEEALDPAPCFACGFDGGKGNLERAHILARCEGGSDAVDNLHMLCSTCHKASEGLTGDPYWAWFVSRTYLDRALQVSAKYGANLGQLISLAG